MSAILNTYNRKKISFKRGKGSFLYASNGKKYLDFVQGIAVNCLGHANIQLNRAVQSQSKKLKLLIFYKFLLVKIPLSVQVNIYLELR